MSIYNHPESFGYTRKRSGVLGLVLVGTLADDSGNNMACAPGMTMDTGDDFLEAVFMNENR